MKWVLPLLAGLAGGMLMPAVGAVQSRDTKPAPPKSPNAEMLAMMEKARRYTQPGRAHRELERFVGKRDTESRFFMNGKPTPAEKGTAEFSWPMPGRWLQGETQGAFMGRPSRTFSLMGYDNFKQSFVTTSISNADTAMTHAEGDMDPSGRAIISYGTLDEYLTGEHDKMVKHVWRFPSRDRMVMEIHDLPIGESNTKVVEFTFTRQR